MYNRTLRCATLHYATLRYSALRYCTLRYATLHYPTLRYATVRYSTLRCATLRCATLRYATQRVTKDTVWGLVLGSFEKSSLGQMVRMHRQIRVVILCCRLEGDGEMGDKHEVARSPVRIVPGLEILIFSSGAANGQGTHHLFRLRKFGKSWIFGSQIQDKSGKPHKNNEQIGFRNRE